MPRQVGAIVEHLDQAGVLRRGDDPKPRSSESDRPTGAIMPPERRVRFAVGDEIVYTDRDGDEHSGTVTDVLTRDRGREVAAYVITTMKFTRGSVTVFDRTMLRAASTGGERDDQPRPVARPEA
jgi:hypothetical protein